MIIEKLYQIVNSIVVDTSDIESVRGLEPIISGIEKEDCDGRIWNPSSRIMNGWIPKNWPNYRSPIDSGSFLLAWPRLRFAREDGALAAR